MGPPVGFEAVRPSRLGSRSSDLQSTLIAAYAALASIYWLPGVPYALIAPAKTALFALLAALALPSIRSANRDTVMLLRLITAAAVMTALAFLLTSTFDQVVKRSLDYINPMVWILIMNSIPASRRDIFLKKLGLFFTVFCIFAAYPIVALLGLAPDITPPQDLIQSDMQNLNLMQLQSLSISMGGYNGSYAGWGFAVGISALLFAALLFADGSTKRRRLAIGLLGVVIAYLALIGARGSAVCMLIICTLWVAMSVRNKTKFVVSTAAIMVVLSQVNLRGTISSRFFQDAAGGGASLSQLNSLTTGRVETYITAINNFISSPIYGVGYDSAKTVLFTGQVILVHNIWLRAAAEGGLFELLPMFAIVVVLIRLAWQTGTIQTSASPFPNAIPAVCMGLMTATFEPNAIFGAFNNNVLFWTAVGLLIFKRTQTNYVQPASPLAATPGADGG